jgi:hypothetical protein
MQGSRYLTRLRFFAVVVVGLASLLAFTPNALAEESGSDIRDTANSLDLNVLSMGLNILIAGTFIWLIFRDKENHIQNRMTLVALGLLFLGNSFIFTFQSIVESGFGGLSDDFSGALSLTASALNIFTAFLFPIIFMLFPSPIFTQRKHFIGVVIFLIATFFVLLIGFAFGIISFLVLTIIFNIIGVVGFLIPVRWYLLYRDSDDAFERNHAIGAGLIGAAILVSQGMTSWTSLLVYGGESHIYGFGSGANTQIGEVGVAWEVVVGHLRSVVPIMLLLYIVYKELVLPKEKRSVALRSVALIILFIGLLNALVVGFINDEEIQSLWDFFVIQGSFGLVRPLIVVFIILKFDLFDMRKDELRRVARLVALLLVSVWVAMVFEILQAFLPVPQLLSAALIGVVLAFAVGWEDRFFEHIAAVSDDPQLMQISAPFDEDDPARFMSLGALIMMFCLLLGFIVGGSV